MTKNCKHLKVGRTCVVAQECGGKGRVYFGLLWSLVSIVKLVLFS